MRHLWCMLCACFVISAMLGRAAEGQGGGCCTWTLKYFINISPESVTGNGDDTTKVNATPTVNNATGQEDVETAGESDNKTREQTATGQYEWSVSACEGWAYKWRTSTQGSLSQGNSVSAGPLGHSKATTQHDLTYTKDLSVSASDSASCEATAYTPGSPPQPLPKQTDSDTISGTIQDMKEMPGTKAEVGTESHVKATWLAEFVIPDTFALQEVPTARAPLKFEGWCDEGADGTFESYIEVTVDGTPPEEADETTGDAEYEREESAGPLWGEE